MLETEPCFFPPDVADTADIQQLQAGNAITSMQGYS